MKRRWTWAAALALLAGCDGPKPPCDDRWTPLGSLDDVVAPTRLGRSSEGSFFVLGTASDEALSRLAVVRADGARAWTWTAEDDATTVDDAAPVAEGGFVLVLRPGNELVKLDASGAELWRRSLGDDSETIAVLGAPGDGRICFGGAHGAAPWAGCLDEEGGVAWSVDVPLPSGASGAVDRLLGLPGGYVAVAGRREAGGGFVALAAPGGLPIPVALGSPYAADDVPDALDAAPDGTLVVSAAAADGQSGSLFALDTGGRVAWKVRLPDLDDSLALATPLALGHTPDAPIVGGRRSAGLFVAGLEGHRASRWIAAAEGDLLGLAVRADDFVVLAGGTPPRLLAHALCGPD